MTFFLKKVLQIDKRWYRVNLLGCIPNRKFMKGKIMKKTLFAVALLASSSAFAMDVSNPFYVPMKGDFLSDTNVDYVNLEHGNVESAVLSETLSYGVTRNFSVNATVEDTWLFDIPGVTGHDRYDNPAWGVGMKYNLVDCCKTNWKVQLGADYEQGGVDHHDKEFSGYVKTGYQLGSLLPYVTLTGYKPVGKYESDPGLAVRMAADLAFSKKVNLDFGATYDWAGAKESWKNGSTKHESEWSLDTTLYYVFSDCMAVGLKGSYVLDAKPYNYDAYSVGVNFKVAF